MLFCLTGCSNDNGIRKTGFGHGRGVAYRQAVAGVVNREKVYNRENIKIELYYGWSQEHEKNYLFTNEYNDNSLIKLVAMSHKA